MNLQLQQFKTIKLSDPFFDTLKSDYEEFEDWFAKKTKIKPIFLRAKMAQLRLPLSED